MSDRHKYSSDGMTSPQGETLLYEGRNKFVDTDMEYILHKFSTSMIGDILTGRVTYPRKKSHRRDKKAMDRDPLKTKEEASAATQKAQHKFQSRPTSRRITIGGSPLPGLGGTNSDGSDSMFKTPGQPHLGSLSSSSSDSASSSESSPSDHDEQKHQDPFKPSDELENLGRVVEETRDDFEKAPP